MTDVTSKRKNLSYRILSCFIAVTFISNVVLPPAYAQVAAQTFLNLPAPGTMVSLSAGFAPALVKGLTIDPANPLQFEFFISKGDSKLGEAAFKEESQKLIKYFLASLTVPEEELWVNLSPYEKDRIIPQGFGETEMGRDMLAQDYILKQLTASLMYPEKELGKKFWDEVYKKARQKYGTADIPVDTFNKVWIVPDKAVLYEHGNSVFVVESHLKVMLESDYQAQKFDARSSMLNTRNSSSNEHPASSIGTSIIKEVIIPALENEVNEGKSFATLRQIYHSSVLAVWYKQNLQKSLLAQVYADQNKIKGIDLEDKNVKQKIYDQYLEAFKKGVYNYIKEDYDPATRATIPRKYFSGGTNLTSSPIQERLTSAKWKSYPADVQQRIRNVANDSEHASVVWAAVEDPRPEAIALATRSKPESALEPAAASSPVDESIKKINTQLVQSNDFINDLNDRLVKDFGKGELKPSDLDKARALSYEVDRRLSSRDGAIQFQSRKRSEYAEGEIDPGYDRYNRVLEGVIQILNKDEYGADNVIVNSWGYTDAARKLSLKNGSEVFAKIFFLGIVQEINRLIAHEGHPINAPPQIQEILRQIGALTEDEIEQSSAKDLADKYVRPLIDSEAGLTIFPQMQQKFYLFSAGPGTGKDAIWKAFREDYGGLIDKLALYHSRNPRVDKGLSEKDGDAYHFRKEQELNALAKDYPIIRTSVNRQLQGLTKRRFNEPMSFPSSETAPDKMRKVYDGEDGHLKDLNVREENGIITLDRPIYGLEDVFKEDKKAVVLEGGYGWFLNIRKEYPDISVAFIAPFSDEAMDIRAKNHAWVEKTFQTSEKIYLAYQKLFDLIEKNEGEIDLLERGDLQESIKQAVDAEFGRDSSGDGTSSSPLTVENVLKEGAGIVGTLNGKVWVNYLGRIKKISAAPALKELLRLESVQAQLADEGGAARARFAEITYAIYSLTVFAGKQEGKVHVDDVPALLEAEKKVYDALLSFVRSAQRNEDYARTVRVLTFLSIWARESRDVASSVKGIQTLQWVIDQKIVVSRNDVQRILRNLNTRYANKDAAEWEDIASDILRGNGNVRAPAAEVRAPSPVGLQNYLTERQTTGEITPAEAELVVQGVNDWLTRRGYPHHLVTKLQRLIAQEDWATITESFYRTVEFGTAGKRGRQVDAQGDILPGPNNINDYTVAEYTLGLARYLIKTGQQDRGVVLGGDTRIKSVLPYKGEEPYTELQAKILRKMGIKVYRFQEPRSIGHVAWTAVHNDAASMEYNSASHNMWMDNGVKASNEFGAQLFADERKGILEEIQQVTPEDIDALELDSSDLFDLEQDRRNNPDKHILLGSAQDHVQDPSIVDADTQYIRVNQKYVENPEIVRQHSGEVNSFYTPIQGSGVYTIPAILTDGPDFNFNVIVSEDQRNQDEDGRFGTTEKPDPNYVNQETGVRTLDKAIKEAEKVENRDKIKFDFIFGTDPDSDRVSFAVRDREGKWAILKANDAWSLLAWYRLNQLRQQGKLREGAAILATWATTDLIADIAQDPQFGLKVYRPAVGFNKIAEVALKEVVLPILVQRHQGVDLAELRKMKVLTLDKLAAAFGVSSRKEMMQEINSILSEYLVMGAEESNGYSPGGHTLEKDGSVAAVTFHEIAAFVKYVNSDKEEASRNDPYLRDYFQVFGNKDLTLFELLNRVYLQYGYYATENIPLQFSGLTGNAQKDKVLRTITELAIKVNEAPGITRLGDKFIQEAFTGKEQTSTANVQFNEAGYKFTLGGKDYVLTRPSGTEPYIRFYGQTRVSPDGLNWNNIELRKTSADQEAKNNVLAAQKMVNGGVSSPVTTNTDLLDEENEFYADPTVQEWSERIGKVYNMSDDVEQAYAINEVIDELRQSKDEEFLLAVMAAAVGELDALRAEARDFLTDPDKQEYFRAKETLVSQVRAVAMRRFNELKEQRVASSPIMQEGLLVGIPRAIESLRDQNLHGVRVMVRANLNVPINEKGEIEDTARIVELFPLLDFLTDKGANVILLGHKGRDKDRVSVKPVKNIIANRYPTVPVTFYDESITENGLHITRESFQSPKGQQGSIDILENVRFARQYEQGGKGSPQREEFGRRLADLADIFIFEAAGDLASEGASVEDLPRHFADKGGEIFVGPATIKETEMLDPVVRDGIDAIIFGGVKEDKVKPLVAIMKNLSEKIQFVLLGSSSSRAITTGDELLKKLYESNPEKMFKALDYDSLTTTNDIGDQTIALYLQKLDTLRAGQTVLVNGTMGWVEKEYRKGTEKVINKLKELAQRGVRIVVIGGDGSSNARRYGLDQQPNVYMFTGGGVQLKRLAGKPLTGVVALQEAHDPSISARKKKAGLLRLIVKKKRLEATRNGATLLSGVETSLNAFKGSLLDQINEVEQKLGFVGADGRQEKISTLVEDLIAGRKLLAGEDVDVLSAPQESVLRIDRKIAEELGYSFSSASSPVIIEDWTQQDWGTEIQGLIDSSANNGNNGLQKQQLADLLRKIGLSYSEEALNLAIASSREMFDTLEAESKEREALRGLPGDQQNALRKIRARQTLVSTIRAAALERYNFLKREQVAASSPVVQTGEKQAFRLGRFGIKGINLSEVQGDITVGYAGSEPVTINSFFNSDGRREVTVSYISGDAFGTVKMKPGVAYSFDEKGLVVPEADQRSVGMFSITWDGPNGNFNKNDFSIENSDPNGILTVEYRSSSPINVLVVDTNKNNLVSYDTPAGVLRGRSKGYNIFEVKNAEEASRILSKEEINVVVSDLDSVKEIARDGRVLPPVVMSASDVRSLNGQLPPGIKIVPYERGYMEDALPRAITQAVNGNGASSSPAAEGKQAAPGGIDLNPALLDLQIKRDANFVPLPLPQQPIQQMHIEGFIPVIINITPATNLPLLLGLADTEQNADDAAKPDLKARDVEEISALN